MEYQIPEPIPEIYISKENNSPKEKLTSSKILWQKLPQNVNERTLEPSDSHRTNRENKELKSYLTFGAGTFIRGAWNPRPIGHCNVWRACFERLEGLNGFAAYTKEIFKKGVWSFDYDITGMLGNQSTNENYAYEEIGYNSGIFGVLGIIPTVRISKLGNKLPFGIGLGVGPSYTFGSRVVEKPYDISKLLSQVNAEINIPIQKDKSTSIVLGLSHVCTFWGALEGEDGRTFGHHWYTLGIRKKL